MDNRPKMNVEAFAFVYLMADTEAIMHHYQGNWITDQPMLWEEKDFCGTAGCLAGHACVYEKGSIEAARYVEYSRVAVETLWNAKREELPLEILADLDCAEAMYLYPDAELPEEDGIFGVIDEDEALQRFREHVYKFGTREEIDRFEDLISLDASELLHETELTHVQ